MKLTPHIDPTTGRPTGLVMLAGAGPYHPALARALADFILFPPRRRPVSEKQARRIPAKFLPPPIFFRDPAMHERINKLLVVLLIAVFQGSMGRGLEDTAQAFAGIGKFFTALAETVRQVSRMFSEQEKPKPGPSPGMQG